MDQNRHAHRMFHLLVVLTLLLMMLDLSAGQATATTNPSAVTGLPNTGAQPAESARDELLFTALALLLGLLAAAAVMTKRQRR